jgi:hypothetical protein
MFLRHSLAPLLVLLGTVAQAQAAPGAPLVVPCVQERPRDLAADVAEARRVTAPVEAAQTFRLQAFDRETAGRSGPDVDRRFLDLQHRYQHERFEALRPLAQQGNASAILGLAWQYRSADSGFADAAEGTRLMHCAASLGEPGARLELMMETWHDKGDGSFAAIQRNRIRTLDLVEQAADDGDFNGVLMLVTYIGGGHHQYAVEPDLARRLLALCARSGNPACRRSLVEAAETRRAYALPDPAETYVLLTEVADAEPARYAARRETAWTALTPEQRASVEERTAAWRPVAWLQLKPEWTALREEVVAKGDPSSVTCLRMHLCPRV